MSLEDAEAPVERRAEEEYIAREGWSQGLVDSPDSWRRGNAFHYAPYCSLAV